MWQNQFVLIHEKLLFESLGCSSYFVFFISFLQKSLSSYTQNEERSILFSKKKIKIQSVDKESNRSNNVILLSTLKMSLRSFRSHGIRQAAVTSTSQQSGVFECIQCMLMNRAWSMQFKSAQRRKSRLRLLIDLLLVNYYSSLQDFQKGIAFVAYLDLQSCVLLPLLGRKGVHIVSNFDTNWNSA